MVLVTAVASATSAPGRRLLPAHLRVRREDLRGRQDPRRLLQARGAPDARRRSSPAASSIARRVRCSPRAGAIDTQIIATVLSTDKENPTDVLAHDRRRRRRCTSPTSRGRARSPASASAASTASSSSTRPSPQREQSRHRPGRRRAAATPSSWSRAARREVSEDGHRRRADVRAPGGAAGARPAGEAARGGRQAEARVRAAGQGRGDRRARSRSSPTQKLEAAMAIRDKHAALRRRSTPPAPRSRRRSAEEFPDARPREESARRSSRAQEEASCASWCSTTGRRIDGRATTDDPPDHVRGRRAAAHARLGAVHARRDAGARHRRRSAPSRTSRSIDALIGDVEKRFMLHYNFPPFSTGEAKPLRGAGRREIGHGALAERALARMLPAHEEFPYTIRIVSRDPRVERLARRWRRSAAARWR